MVRGVRSQGWVRHELGSENTGEWDKRWVRSQAQTDDKSTGRSKESSTALRKLDPGSVQEAARSSVGEPRSAAMQQSGLDDKGEPKSSFASHGDFICSGSG